MYITRALPALTYLMLKSRGAKVNQ